MFFSLLRLIPIPSQLPDLIPVIFKVNNLNYFLGKLIGSLVSYLLLVNLTNQLLINLDLKSHLVDQKDVLNFLISIFLVIAVLFVGYNLRFLKIIEFIKKKIKKEKIIFCSSYCGYFLPNWRKNISYKKTK